METRPQRILLNIALCAIGLVVADPSWASDAETPQVIEPQVDRRHVTLPDIDSENVEITLFGGIMNVEDFGSNPVYGLRVAFHVSEDLFIEAAGGITETEKNLAEELSGFNDLVEDDDRKLTYYNLSLGYNILPGEAFITRKWTFTTDFYLIGGVGSTTFLGDSEFTGNIGAGYRFLITDWLAGRIDARDHMFKMSIGGISDNTHNLEFSGGLAAFF
jgi:outer membrane beta-barrel protein